MSLISESISLRSWIKGAAGNGRNDNCIANAASSTYVAACLKIAVSLTEQISRAEKLAELGVYRELEMLPNRRISDWAEFVRIRLINDNSRLCHQERPAQGSWKEFESLYQPLPYGTCITDSNVSALWEDNDEGAIDEHLKLFLDALAADELDTTEVATHKYHDALSLSPVKCDAHTELRFCPAISSDAEDVVFLNIDSAFIRHPENDSVANTPKDKQQRIFCIGLLFYEIFSGGEPPPRGLVSLLSSEGAFISIPKLTLTEKKDDHNASKTDIKRHRGPAGSCNGIGLCQISFEYLKLLGLPGPLCSLVLNMLDCIHGDFSGNDCYTKIVDVTTDLQLMMDQPDKFLRNLDVEKLLISGLDLNENVFLREDELASIQSSYQRSVTESCEFAIIAGESGTGKSWLAQRVGRFISAQGGLFLSGKFDQMKHVTPFAVLASVFDQYCDVLIKEKESDWAKGIVNRLNFALGKDSYHLMKVIPKLNDVLPRNTSFGTTSSSQNCVNAVQRLHYLICQFVDVISTFSVASVTLFLDDLQWADAASITVLNQLLSRKHTNFFVLGCCRDTELESRHPLRDTIENIRELGIKTTIVRLRCMEKNSITQMVSNLLCLSPRVVRSLADIIYTKTKGNPLFFSQVMFSLYREGLLRLSLCDQRWVWDEEEIHFMKLPDDIALCFANGISKLPLFVQSALRTLSMFGASAKCEYIEALESQLHVTLIEPLEVAIKEGLVNIMGGSFHFCHDRIQEASYAMIEEHDRSRNHLILGLALVKLSLDAGEKQMLFTAVNQINLGRSAAVLNAQNRVSMAKYNFAAGKVAMEMSDFMSAFSFFSSGIDFLPHEHWIDHYDFSLELFDLASKCALATGDIRSIRLLADQVLTHAKCLEDKLNTYFIIISSLTYSSKISEALKEGYTILSRLGEDIPNDLSMDALDQHIKQTQSLIRGVSENDILNYRLIKNKRTLAAMKFLAQLESITMMVKPSVHPFVTLKMVQLTMSNGLSPVSPVGIAYFGSLLANRGNIQLGYRFTLLAKALLEKLDAGEVAGEVMMRESLAIQGESAAMAAGDIRWACINRLQYCICLFWTCSNLSVANQAFSEACQFMKEQQHRTSLFFILTIQKTVLIFMGIETETLTENDLSRSLHEKRSPHHLMMLSFQNLYRSFILMNDGMLQEYAERFIELKQSSWVLYFSDAPQTLILGLVAFQLYRKTRDSMWLEMGRKCKSDMKLWAEQGSLWNFQHKFLLLEAEEHFSNASFEDATASYTNAILSSNLHKFINDEALACELAAKFYLETGDLESSLECFRLAHEKYHEWGALGKANILFSLVNSTFDNTVVEKAMFSSNNPRNPSAVSSQGSVRIDSQKRRAV
ncbi:hypothetical protein ACHAW6_013360 [Cyclotella cf. meneghiniana]